MSKRKILYLFIGLLALICVLSIPVFNREAVVTPSNGGTNLTAAVLRPNASRPARVVDMQGTVEVMRGGTRSWTLAYTNQVLHPGDQLRTGQGSRAAISLRNSTVLHLSGLSTVKLPGRRSLLEVIRDTLYFLVPSATPTNINIQTPTVSAEVKG
jgi:FtsP/CotA-like multicopper oxidase with cupredoxin domain